MSQACSGTAPIGAAGWLSTGGRTDLRAIMALMTAVLGGGASEALCSRGGASPLSGMIPMYLLMSAFHAAPWLKLIASRRSGGGRS